MKQSIDLVKYITQCNATTGENNHFLGTAEPVSRGPYGIRRKRGRRRLTTKP